MNWWIFVFCLVGLIFYVISSIMFCIVLNFKFHDSYHDEDITYPRRRPAGIPTDAFLVDLHAHTTISDGLLTPEQLVKWSYANGYDGVVVADHNTLDAVEAATKAAERLTQGFIVIPGTEFTSLRAHLNLIGVKTPMEKPNLLWPSKRAIKAAIDHAHAEGGVVQFNHKAWYPYKVLKSLPREWWMANGIDGWEVYNGFGFVDEEAIEFIEKHKARRVMFASAGTDVHDPAKHYRVYTEMLTSDRSVQGVIDALKAGKTRVHSTIQVEAPDARPEKGKIVLNPERRAYIRRWAWLDWIGL
jgi:predicted metal-dependent phosphoesterase TrpH